MSDCQPGVRVSGPVQVPTQPQSWRRGRGCLQRCRLRTGGRRRRQASRAPRASAWQQMSPGGRYDVAALRMRDVQLMFAACNCFARFMPQHATVSHDSVACIYSAVLEKAILFLGQEDLLLVCKCLISALILPYKLSMPAVTDCTRSSNSLQFYRSLLLLGPAFAKRKVLRPHLRCGGAILCTHT